jgi:predicted Fe-S protein YdhL (DUF1289 family)
MSEIESPCIGRCGLTTDGTCHGCLRSIREIVSWPRMSNDQKSKLLNDLENRKSERPDNQ